MYTIPSSYVLGLILIFKLFLLKYIEMKKKLYFVLALFFYLPRFLDEKSKSQMTEDYYNTGNGLYLVASVYSVCRDYIGNPCLIELLWRLG